MKFKVLNELFKKILNYIITNQPTLNWKHVFKM